MGAGDAAIEGTGDWIERAMSSVSVSAGIPRSASTAHRAYAPSPNKTGLVGNPHPGVKAAASPAPAQPSFSISYPTPVGRKTLALVWQPGRRIRDYLRGHHLIATWLRYRSIDADRHRKVRLNEVPYPGQRLVLQHASGGRVT